MTKPTTRTKKARSRLLPVLILVLAASFSLGANPTANAKSSSGGGFSDCLGSALTALVGFGLGAFVGPKVGNIFGGGKA